MRLRLVSGNQNVRLPLIASLLFGCFESFYGNWETATQQFASSRNLLNTYETGTEGRKRAKSPQIPSLIDPEIAPALDRLEVQKLSFLVVNPIYDLPIAGNNSVMMRCLVTSMILLEH